MILTIILLAISIAVLVAMLIDKHRHPEAYATPQPKRRRVRHSRPKYTGLPWMGGKRIR